MLKLVKLDSYRAQDTVAVLRCLLDQAERGELAGVAVYPVRQRGGGEVITTGRIKRNQVVRTAAGLHLYWALARADVTADP